ncbi:hypothetical protein BFF98_10325 [Corynebacterium pseudotuberculosis]|nr:hypothetical protein BFF98_10325 [Corynebacterium pseudotuberculosis]
MSSQTPIKEFVHRAAWHPPSNYLPCYLVEAFEDAPCRVANQGIASAHGLIAFPAVIDKSMTVSVVGVSVYLNYDLALCMHAVPSISADLQILFKRIAHRAEFSEQTNLCGAFCSYSGKLDYSMGMLTQPGPRNIAD